MKVVPREPALQDVTSKYPLPEKDDHTPRGARSRAEKELDALLGEEEGGDWALLGRRLLTSESTIFPQEQADALHKGSWVLWGQRSDGGPPEPEGESLANKTRF